MTKAELVAALAEKMNVPKTVSSMFLDTIGGVVTAALSKGDEITLPGIGKLAAVQKAAREGRNPRTGVTATIPAKKAVKFKAASILKDAIN